MATTATTRRGRTPFRLTEADCRLEDFAALVDHTTELVDYPNPVEVQLDVVVYDCAALRTATSASCPTRSRRATRRTCICCRRCSPCRAPLRTPRCRWKADRRCTSRIPISTPPATWPGAGRSFVSSSPAATYSFRWPKATRCSSTRRCSTARGTTRPPTCSGWQTCCRCPRRFGRAMETVDPVKMAKCVYPILRARLAAGLDPASLTDAINCAAEGYPFPSNLDLDENVGGLTPRAQTALLEQALTEDWSPDRVAEALDGYAARPASTRSEG